MNAGQPGQAYPLGQPLQEQPIGRVRKEPAIRLMREKLKESLERMVRERTGTLYFQRIRWGD